jgi:two-component system chemotaxis sensor kinase CheA
MDLSEVIDAYILESEELLRDMENILLEMEKKHPTEEDLNALFRSVHTIKGTSGMFGFDQTVKFTHKVENLLDDVRAGKVAFTKTLADILLKAKDQLDYLVTAEPKKDVSNERIQMGKEILDAIEPFLKAVPRTQIEIKKEEASHFESAKQSTGTSHYLISSQTIGLSIRS